MRSMQWMIHSVGRGRRSAVVILLVCALLALTGCRRAASTAGPQFPTRTPRATFTVTPRVLIAGQEAPVGQVESQPTLPPVVDAPAPLPTPVPLPDTPAPDPTATPIPEPRAIVTSPSINLRAGPGTEFALAGQVDRGTELTVVGRNGDGQWLQVCCVDAQQAWVAGWLVDTVGPVENVAVASDIPVAPPTVAPPPPTATSPPQPTAPPAPAAPTFAFDLIAQEQFPETNTVRVFTYVISQDGVPLPGYSLRVRHDGGDRPAKGVTHGPPPELTWPINDARQRFHNLKVEFPETPGGVWTVSLIDGGGNQVGPEASFALTGNDESRELYVRYRQK